MAYEITNQQPKTKVDSDSPITTQKPKSNKLFFIIIGLILMVLLIAYFWTRKNTAEKAAPPVAIGSKANPLAVTTTSVNTRELPKFIEATGSLIADEASDVSSQASGQVIATPVDVGAFVTQGTVIARLDDRDAQLKLQQARAAEQQAVAALRQAQARLGLGANGKFDVNAIPEVRAALDNVASARAQARLARANERRYAALIESGDVARTAYDQYRTQAETAEASANSAQRQYEVAINAARLNNQGIAREEANVASARAQVSLAQKAVNDTVIKAPFSGYISERPVAAGESVTPATKVATLMRTQSVKLRAQVPEAEVANLRVGMGVMVKVEGYADREFSGEITAINPAIDPNSRAVAVEAEIKNANNQLRSGMFATARIQQPGTVPGIFIPASAAQTQTDSATAQLYVIEGDTARVRVVQLGEREGELVRVVSGLKGDEVIATNQLEQLFDGAIVKRN